MCGFVDICLHVGGRGCDRVYRNINYKLIYYNIENVLNDIAFGLYRPTIYIYVLGYMAGQADYRWFLIDH